jgi:hypothetical protein
MKTLEQKRFEQKVKLQTNIIREWFDACNPCNPCHQKGIEKACLIIYALQTNAEKHSEETHELNGKGFSGRDAKFGSAMAQKILQTRAGMSEYTSLTPNMYAALKRMLRKYAKQLATEYVNKKSVLSPEN